MNPMNDEIKTRKKLRLSRKQTDPLQTAVDMEMGEDVADATGFLKTGFAVLTGLRAGEEAEAESR